MNSPEYIQTSLAAAISLGLEPGRFKEKVKLTGLNLLLVYDDKCIGRCAYCGLSAQRLHSENVLSDRKSKTFIRVKWPVYRLDEVIRKTKENSADFQRICISMITKSRAFNDTVTITEKIHRELPHPVSILISPTILKGRKELEILKEAGADMIGIAIDAACRSIFSKLRGSGVKGPHKWEKYWKILKDAIDVFGKFNAGIHLIAGLGETEEEMVKTIWDAHKMGAKTHLFSFFPEAFSELENLEPPDLFHYRKIQIARYLINEKQTGIDKIKFDTNGKIISIDYDINEIIEEGFAFTTSGCPGTSEGISACNRPLANERPSEPFRNYPYLPDSHEKEIIRKQVASLIN